MDLKKDAKKVRVQAVTQKSPPRIGPASELTLQVQLSQGEFTLNSIEIVKGGRAVKEIDIQGDEQGPIAATPESKGTTFNVVDPLIFQGSVEIVVYFSSSLNDLEEIKETGLQLKLNTTTIVDKVASPCEFTITQPVIIDGLTPAPTVISRKDSVPTQYTRNIERFEAIQNTAEKLKFEKYAEAVDALLCKGTADEPYRDKTNRLLRGRSLPFTGDDAYRVLKAATEAYLLLNGTADFSTSGYNADLAARIGAVGGFGKDPGGEDSSMTRYFQLVYARLPNEQLKKQVFPAYDELSGRLD